MTPGPEAVEPPQRRIQLKLYEADGTFVRDLTTDLTGTRAFTPELPGIGAFGTAAFSIPLFVTSEALSEMVPNVEATDLTRGRIVRYYLDGELRFAAVIRPRRQTSAASKGHSALVRSLRMEGVLSEWDRAVLPPHPGAVYFLGGEIRNFGWMSPEADIDDLDDAVFLRPVFADGYSHPDPWVDGFGYVFDASTHRYFVYDQEVDEADAPLAVSVHQAFADQGTGWVNGVSMGQTDGPPSSAWGQTHHGGARLPEGVTRWAFEVQGLPGSPDPRWAATAFAINDATTGSMNGDTILWRTGYITGVTPYPWKASATPQGPTAKRIIRSALTQVQEEQEKLLGWSIEGDDDSLDANGNELDRIAHVPFRVGCKLGSEFLLGMAKSWCDLDVDYATKTLRVFRWRERGNFHTSPASAPVFSDAAFAPVDGRLPNVLDMVHEERIR